MDVSEVGGKGARDYFQAREKALNDRGFVEEIEAEKEAEKHRQEEAASRKKAMSELRNKFEQSYSEQLSN